jgi:hypothetical protein
VIAGVTGVKLGLIYCNSVTFRGRALHLVRDDV